jgi:DNA invertase Pin-like site-specific DNA recombinase
MSRLLTVGMLVALLWPWATPSDVRAQGPGPREVPSELWEEYPLEEPRSKPRQETRERRSDRHQPAAPIAINRETSDGSSATTTFLIVGLLLLAASAVLVFARASGRRVIERSRRPSAPGPRPPTRSTQSSSPAPDREAKAPASPGRQPALGYASVTEGGDDNDSMRRQQEEIDAVCSRKGLALLELVRDVESRGSDLNRPGLTYALEHLKAHEASCLVVSSLERLTGSAANLGTLVEWLDRWGARLVVADIDLDTGTPEGGVVAKALTAVGGSERKTLMQRTPRGPEAARQAQRFSRQPAVSDESALKHRIAEMRAGGMTLQAIADTLNAEGVPTLRGGALWRPSSVQAAVGYKRPKRASRLA